MFIFDTTAIIALVSELNYDIDCITQISQERLKYFSSQIKEENKNPGQLLEFLNSFTNINVIRRNFDIADTIIRTIGGDKEQSR